MILAFLFILVSCDRALVFEENRRIEKSRWDQDQKVSFTFHTEDTLSINNFYINIRNTTNYKYRNVFFFINTIFPDGRMFRDTVECYLADKNGKWLGKGMGKIKDNRVLIRKGIRFPVKGTYTLELEQAMREEELKGIADIGIRIERIN